MHLSGISVQGNVGERLMRGKGLASCWIAATGDLDSGVVGLLACLIDHGIRQSPNAVLSLIAGSVQSG